MLERILARLTVNAVVIAILVVALAVQTVRIEGFKFWPISHKGLKAELQSERGGRKDDRRRYAQAQADAAAKNKADVARIESEQERITHEVQSDLTARLERLRRELRSNAAPKGSPGQPGSPADGKAAGGTDEEAGVCLTSEQLLRAAENEERHDQLITWIEQQLGVKR